MDNKATEAFSESEDVLGSLWCGCTNRYVNERGHRKNSNWNI